MNATDLGGSSGTSVPTGDCATRSSWAIVLWCALGAVLHLFLTDRVLAQQHGVELLRPVDLEVATETDEEQKVDPHTSTRTSTPEQCPTSPAKQPQPYKGTSFTLNDFSYLEDPNNTAPYQPVDELKRIHIGDCVRLDIGGEYRNRYHIEQNMRLDGKYDDFDLHRVRLYSDLWYDEWFRFYLETIDAVSFYEELPPRSIDENRSDFLQLFTDIKLAYSCGGPLYLRLGRQELFYGSERLMSSPDWSNVRRTFEGAKLFWRGEAWNVDAFWARPDIPVDPHNFDSPDLERQLAGLFSAYHGIKDQTIDLYYLWIGERDAKNGFVNSVSKQPGDFTTNTLAARWLGRRCDWLWEIEGAVQIGEFAAIDHRAGMYSAGVGYDFEFLPAKPVFWVYYDFASGDSDPADNRQTTFDQLFPAGHRYMGWMDLVARENIRDLNFRLDVKPLERLEFVMWYHIFRLDEPRDNLYNSSGRIIRSSDPSGADGADVGQEIDMTLTFQITPRVQWVLGYSHFFSGDFIRNSAPANPGAAGDADFFYSQISVRF